MAKQNLKVKEESNVQEISGNRLKSFIERVERLEVLVNDAIRL